MIKTSLRRRLGLRLASAGIAAASIATVTAVAAQAADTTSVAAISGSGSTWAQGIITPWIAQLQANGLTINYKGNGSSAGRTAFASGQVQFADSDIPYQGTDPVTGTTDASSRPYVYVPVVAGGTAFTYTLHVHGQLVTNLRLSGETITKIFTNVITNWNDPQITRDNGGKAFPSLQIAPVVRSDGSGATAQFTLWMAKKYPTLWKNYNGSDTLTSVYPRKGNQIAVQGDDGIITTVKAGSDQTTAGSGEGTIGYTAYSYPVAQNWPVAQLGNASGNFVWPTQFNVAVALQGARIVGCNASTGECSPAGVDKTQYLTQNLDGVYANSDPRAYPLSSYSYFIIPSSKADQFINSPQRRALGQFLRYALCDGQGKAGPYGYSPLPLNLVRAAFTQVQKLGPTADGGAVPNVPISNPITSASDNTCGNPTFVAGHLDQNALAVHALMPISCHKATATPCTPAQLAQEVADQQAAALKTIGGTVGSPANAPGVGGGSGSPTGAGSTGGGSTAIDPTTGQPVSGGSGATTPGTGGNTGTASAANYQLAASRPHDNSIFGATAVLELIAIVLLPGLYVAWLRRRTGASQ